MEMAVEAIAAHHARLALKLDAACPFDSQVVLGVANVHVDHHVSKRLKLQHSVKQCIL